MTTPIIYVGSTEQGLLEEKVYGVQFFGATSISSPVVYVYNRAGTDVKATVMSSGSPSVSGTDTVVLPTMKDLALVDVVYRVIVVATVNGQPKVSRAIDVVPRDEKAV